MKSVAACLPALNTGHFFNIWLPSFGFAMLPRHDMSTGSFPWRPSWWRCWRMRGLTRPIHCPAVRNFYVDHTLNGRKCLVECIAMPTSDAFALMAFRACMAWLYLALISSNCFLTVRGHGVRIRASVCPERFRVTRLAASLGLR